MLDFLKVLEPKYYSADEYSNLLSFYDDEIICTRDFNLCMGFKIKGISYSALNGEEEISKQNDRIAFLNSLSSDLEINIFCKKEQIIFNTDSTIQNTFARSIIQKWENKFKASQISYYLFVSTKNKSLSGFFEKQKESLTTESKNESKQDIKFNLGSKFFKIQEFKNRMLNILKDYGSSTLSSKESLDFYIEYMNFNKESGFVGSNDFFDDNFVSSQIEFKKNYFIHTTNNDSVLYSTIISIKSYTTNIIYSELISNILFQNLNLYIVFHINSLNRGDALKKVHDSTLMAVNDEIEAKLKQLEDLIKTDSENIFNFSFSILIKSESKEELDEQSNLILSILKRAELTAVKESLNLKPLYFSFFPAQSHLNARIKKQTGAIVSTLITFENNILGFNKNSFGDCPVTILKHLGGSPFLFNFHESSKINEPGHTLVIGGTGYGKTTLMSFLMMNLFKYDISIFAMDKSNGMHNFTNYLNGEYHNVEDLRFNPFSLKNDAENKNFLKTFLKEMGGILETDYEEKKAIANTIENLYMSINTFQLKDFYDSLEAIEGLKIRFETYLESIFDNQDDALNFNNQLSIINMDSIIKDKTLASLAAFFIFHKLKKVHKDMGKGYFIWIDELRDYLNHEKMGGLILEAILEIRKLNGVIVMGVQNIDFFENLSTKDSFLENMSNFIIFPTSSASVLENLEKKLNLTTTELRFLSETAKDERKILLKTKNNGSQILDINLSRLGQYLKVFNSDSINVKKMKDLIHSDPKNWREAYLQDEK